MEVVLLLDLTAEAVGIAVTGMVIVFVALTMLSVFIGMLPKILSVVAQRFPESAGAHGHAPSHPGAQSDQDEDDVLAAIGFVLHVRHRGQLRP